MHQEFIIWEVGKGSDFGLHTYIYRKFVQGFRVISQVCTIAITNFVGPVRAAPVLGVKVVLGR
jgi:hypothetical protein